MPDLACAAEDKVLMFDLDLVELVAKLRPQLPTVQTYIVLTDRGHMHKAVRIRPQPIPKVHTEDFITMSMSAAVFCNRSQQIYDLPLTTSIVLAALSGSSSTHLNCFSQGTSMTWTFFTNSGMMARGMCAGGGWPGGRAVL